MEYLLQIDMKKMPLGKISKKNITKAYAILGKCQKVLYCLLSLMIWSRYWISVLA